MTYDKTDPRMTKLRNGATIIDYRDFDGPNDYLRLLLCFNSYTGEYVSWIQNLQDRDRGFDGTYHGQYSRNASQAIATFRERATQYA